MSIQSIQNSIEDVQKKIKSLIRDHYFKKANLDREKAADLQHALAQCRGKLEVCQKEFRRAIQDQSANIRRGRASHFDTLMQERILWDAAVGYMLVQDAIFALSTISSHDSVANAYDLLDTALKQMKNSNAKPSKKLFEFTKNKERNSYGYITSSESVKRKEELLDGFFAELIQTGDIDDCLSHAEYPEKISAARRSAYAGNANAAGASTEMDRYAAILDAIPDDNSEEKEIEINGLENIGSMNPPKV